MAWTSHGSLMLGHSRDARAECLTGASSVQLRIETDGLGVSLYPSGDSGREVTDETVTFARQLAEAASAYLAEVERLHTEQAKQSGRAAA
ncbi:hypothetical protein NE236_05805 [Actinoallomurus purpureus]|uniref:hypothetical protein n=1 Tax=Actinoallomurus purpureus TaxID=478114 RepID=UPI002093DA06|nr:hypothetical protein [Actinoallomurus purpureus]MCO6004490.1 hypothetical protein [Actinoallomurus purpureus]